MRRIRVGEIIFWGLVICIMVQFVNCQSLEETGEIPSVSCVEFNQNNCVVPSADDLQLSIPYPYVFLETNQLRFNISGDCNEGGFLGNAVTWELYVRENEEKELISNSEDMEMSTICYQGRFLLLVEIPEQYKGRENIILLVELVGKEGETIHRNELSANQEIDIYYERPGG